MIDFATLTLPPSPNRWLVAPPGFCLHATPDEDAPSFSQDADAVFEALLAVFAAQPRAKLESVDRAGRRATFTQKTALMGFTDDVDVAVLAGDGQTGTRLALYSRSRIGWSDMGANRTRARAWIAALSEALSRAGSS